MEPQGMMAEPEAGGKMFVHGSLQCAYYVHGAVMRALGCKPDGVHIKQDVTGGGFGGKEDFPSILGCQVAVAAKEQTLRYDVFSVVVRTWSSPANGTVPHKISRRGQVWKSDCDGYRCDFQQRCLYHAFPVVLQRGLICASGVYNIPNLHVYGRAMKTNTAPTGAYRGFGAPQTYFAVETMMNHIAYDLGAEPLEFKRGQMVRQGDSTSTSGKYHFPVPLPAMIDEVDGMCGYRKTEFVRQGTKRPVSKRHRAFSVVSWCRLHRFGRARPHQSHRQASQECGRYGGDPRGKRGNRTRGANDIPEDRRPRAQHPAGGCVLRTTGYGARP